MLRKILNEGPVQSVIVDAEPVCPFFNEYSEDDDDETRSNKEDDDNMITVKAMITEVTMKVIASITKNLVMMMKKPV